jgi:hypothetical protein
VTAVKRGGHRTGIGHVDITNTDPMRVIEIGLKFRF